MLTEAHIQRYQRQILLKEVGGAGQERLLAVAVRAVGQGPALAVAAAYAAAGGCRIDGPVSGGFLAGASAADFNPDVDAQSPVRAVFAAAPLAAETGELRLVLGRQGLAWATTDGCGACLALGAAGLGDDDDAVGAVTVGAAAALLLQRWALGFPTPASGRLLRDGPALRFGGPVPCPQHADGG